MPRLFLVTGDEGCEGGAQVFRNGQVEHGIEGRHAALLGDVAQPSPDELRVLREEGLVDGEIFPYRDGAQRTRRFRLGSLAQPLAYAGVAEGLCAFFQGQGDDRSARSQGEEDRSGGGDSGVGRGGWI